MKHDAYLSRFEADKKLEEFMTKRALTIGIIISLSLHVIVFTSLTYLRLPPPPQRQEIEISLVEPAQLPSPRPAQIVDQQEKSVNDEVPEEAKYLSRNNQKVLKETKAQLQGRFANRDHGQMNPSSNQPKAAGEARSQAKGPGPKALLKNLKPVLNWSPEALAQKQGLGPSQTDDHLKDVNVGVQTLLNTREFVYFSYYSRIKEKLHQYWEPKIKDKVQRLLAQGRTIAASQDRVTKMIIVLDHKGILLKIQVISESGIEDLDQAAVEAFQAAAPFPHPPKGIIEEDGKIRIRWDFVLEANNAVLRFQRHAHSDQMRGAL